MVLRNFLYGLIIGIGFIIPGVSGGVIATILGIYDKIIDKLINFKTNIKDNLTFIIPLFTGIITSVFLFSNIILYLLNEKINFISYVFIGLILGCLPYLLKEIKVKSKKNISLLAFLVTFLLGIILYLIEKNFVLETNNPNIFLMIIAGFLYAIGKIVPGISGASLLMLIGVYKYFLTFLANPLLLNFNILIKFIPFVISFIISAIFILKLINFLLTKHFYLTYSAIIGFVLSSILFIMPGNFNLLSFITIFLSFIISYYLSN